MEYLSACGVTCMVNPLWTALVYLRKKVDKNTMSPNGEGKSMSFVRDNLLLTKLKTVYNQMAWKAGIWRSGFIYREFRPQKALKLRKNTDVFLRGLVYTVSSESENRIQPSYLKRQMTLARVGLQAVMTKKLSITKLSKKTDDLGGGRFTCH